MPIKFAFWGGGYFGFWGGGSADFIFMGARIFLKLLRDYCATIASLPATPLTPTPIPLLRSIPASKWAQGTVRETEGLVLGLRYACCSSICWDGASACCISVLENPNLLK